AGSGACSSAVSPTSWYAAATSRYSFSRGSWRVTCDPPQWNGLDTGGVYRDSLAGPRGSPAADRLRGRTLDDALGGWRRRPADGADHDICMADGARLSRTPAPSYAQSLRPGHCRDCARDVAAAAVGRMGARIHGYA